MHLTAEVIENFEGVTVTCTRKFATGESRRIKVYKKKELEALGDEEAQWNEIDLCVEDMFNNLRKSD